MTLSIRPTSFKSGHVERSFVVILLVVCAVHLGLIGYVFFQPATRLQRPVRKAVKVHVQSIALEAARPKPRESVPAPPKAPAPAAVETKPVAVAPKKPVVQKASQKEVTKPATKKEKPPAAQTVVHPPKPKISADKIAQAKANLKKIQRGEVASRPNMATTAAVASIDVPDATPTYEEVLADRLRLLLTLPDYGDVKISLTLNRQGKVLALKILKSASDENRQYVEKTLPPLTLPSFGTSFSTNETHTFQLVLRN